MGIDDTNWNHLEPERSEVVRSVKSLPGWGIWALVSRVNGLSRGRLRWSSMLRANGFPETRPSLFASLEGDAGWRVLFDRYAPAVFQVARFRGLDAHDADDVVQQVMIAITRHIDKYEPGERSRRFRTWVRTITERKIIDLCRQRQRQAAVSTEDMSEQADIELAWDEEWRLLDMLDCLEQVAKRVSAKRMDAFRMYALEGRSADEVAATLGMTPGHVYVTRCQVVEMIRSCIRDLDHGMPSA